MSILLPLVNGGASAPFYPYEVEFGALYRGTQDYLSSTFATREQTKWVFSTWVKRGELGRQQMLLSSYYNSNNRTYIGFEADDTLVVFGKYAGNTRIWYTTQAKFRDPGAWMHICVQYDFSNANPDNRIAVWVNGEWAPLAVTTAITNSLHMEIGETGNAHYLGDYYTGASGFSYDGYMSETYFFHGMKLIDVPGTVAGPEAFGEFNGSVWIPKAVDTGSITFPTTESFYFDYVTAGTNVLPGHNNWAVNGSVSRCKDTPTNNYLTMHDLHPTAVNVSLLQGGTWQSCTATGNDQTDGTWPIFSDKWCFEVIWGSVNKTQGNQMVKTLNQDGATLFSYNEAGATAGLAGSPTLDPFDTGDIISVNLDMDNHRVLFKKNGVTQGTGWYDFNQTPEFCTIRLGNNDHILRLVSGSLGSFNYPAEDGCKELCTANLPEPAIRYPERGFWLPKYVGDQPNTVDVTGAQFNVSTKSMVWLKGRDTALHHALFDTVRGVGNRIMSSDFRAEDAGGLSAFLTDGFRISGSYGVSNTVGENYLAAVFNMLPKYGMDIVEYIGDGTSLRQIPHNLGGLPELIFNKNLDSAFNWNVGCSEVGWDQYLILNGQHAAQTGSTVWGDTEPTATHFTVAASTNVLGERYITYLFRSVPGFSKVGSYAGNATVDNVFVPLDFRPGWLVYKPYLVAGHWVQTSNLQDPFNPTSNYLLSNAADAEATITEINDHVVGGIKIRLSSSSSFIYLTFADQPLKYANAR